MSGLKREDELKLRDLNEAISKDGLNSLSEDDQLLYSLLQDRYNKFLEEGLRKLREATPTLQQQLQQAASPRKGILGLFGNTVSNNSFSANGKRAGQVASDSNVPMDVISSNSTSPSALPLPVIQQGTVVTESNSTESPQLTGITDGPPIGAIPLGEVVPVGSVIETPATATKRTSVDANSSFTNNTPVSTAPEEFVGKHWTWVLDNLVVGAVPYAAPTKDTPGHLSELGEQCYRRNSRISVVLSCMEMDENVPTGFATAKEWDTILGTTAFIHVPLPKNPDTPIPKSFIHEMITACAQINQRTTPVAPAAVPCGAGSPSLPTGSPNSTTRFPMAGGESSSPRPKGLRRLTTIINGKKDEKRRVAYIHCKAGTSRCYVVAACYIMSQLGRNFLNTDEFLRGQRPSLNPSEAQLAFVKEFGEYISKPIMKEPRSDDEEIYQRVLADVLSLAPSLRNRLLQDLEKLT